MKDYKIYDSCFGRRYDANIRECKLCEVAEDCRTRRLEYSKIRMGLKREGEDKTTNPFRAGTAMYVCYESLKQGGTFKQLSQRITEELKRRGIKCINVKKRLRQTIYECKSGKVHSGGEFIHDTVGKTYTIEEKRKV